MRRASACQLVYIVEQITCIFGVNRANCDTSTKVGIDPRWRPFSKMDTNIINLRHQAASIWTN